MTLAPWRPILARALHRNRSLAYARYLQLATVRPDGRPANRTLVFRSFLEGSNQLQFVTDARSQKADQIDQNTAAEICWYFPNTREQFRIAGTLTLVRSTHANSDLLKARQSLWQELSDAARLQFAWPHSGQARAAAAAFNPLPPDPSLPLEHFCLLLLEPTEVDHLELRGDPQNRWIYQRQNTTEWSVEAVNP